MKNVFLFGLIFLIGFSCEKTMQVPERDVPEWLLKIIHHSEETIISDPKANVAYTGWVRYEYRGKDYYENDIPFSSHYPHLYNDEGENPFEDGLSLGDYLENRCCKQVIWKGSKYHRVR